MHAALSGSGSARRAARRAAAEAEEQAWHAALRARVVVAEVYGELYWPGTRALDAALELYMDEVALDHDGEACLGLDMADDFAELYSEGSCSGADEDLGADVDV